MARATWNGEIIAESDEFEIVEGNVYFPRSAVNAKYLRDSNSQTTCPWKGVASYYSLEVGGKQNTDAAWYYPQPKDEAANIVDHIAFWNGVDVER